MNLGFTLIPRLNAAGRMGNAQLALDLLLCDDPAECMRLAAQLEDNNNERRRIEAELSEVAQEQAAQSYTGQRALVVFGEGWHEGVKASLLRAWSIPIAYLRCSSRFEDGERAAQDAA